MQEIRFTNAQVERFAEQIKLICDIYYNNKALSEKLIEECLTALCCLYRYGFITVNQYNYIYSVYVKNQNIE